MIQLNMLQIVCFTAPLPSAAEWRDNGPLSRTEVLFLITKYNSSLYTDRFSQAEPDESSFLWNTQYVR